MPKFSEYDKVRVIGTREHLDTDMIFKTRAGMVPIADLVGKIGEVVGYQDNKVVVNFGPPKGLTTLTVWMEEEYLEVAPNGGVDSRTIKAEAIRAKLQAWIDRQHAVTMYAWVKFSSVWLQIGINDTVLWDSTNCLSTGFNFEHCKEKMQEKASIVSLLAMQETK